MKIKKTLIKANNNKNGMDTIDIGGKCFFLIIYSGIFVKS